MDAVSGHFNGFSPKAIDFLINLGMNNNKTWFEENKQSYKEYILEPFQYLVAELSPTILSIDPLVETTPAVSKTISRIYRDTRFSKDKSPYRSNVWLTFKRKTEEWQDNPCFYFEMKPDSYSYGMGFYSPSRNTMDQFRKAIDNDPDEFLDIILPLEEHGIFTVGGAQYKRLIDGNKQDEIFPWYQRKELYLFCEKPIVECLFCRELADEVAEGFKITAGLYQYLFKVKSISLNSPMGGFGYIL